MRLCRLYVVVVVRVRVVDAFRWWEREGVGGDPLVIFVEVVVYGLDYRFRGGVNGACVWVPHGVEGGKVLRSGEEARRGFKIFVVPFWAVFVFGVFPIFESFVEF